MYPFDTSFRNVCTVHRRFSLFGVCSLFRLTPQLSLSPYLVYDIQEVRIANDQEYTEEQYVVLALCAPFGAR